MEAKDTVMKEIQPHWTVDFILQSQAEISFRAGIREVVEWVAYTDMGGSREDGATIVFYLKEWKAKLKEWGIDAKTD